MKKLDRTIILGIGNNGRQDDGLGWLFLDSLKDLESKLTLEYRYQLQIEDAELISNYKTVIFVDASKSQPRRWFLF
jgi:Ni,Fe-hydrogenase maturation factor